MNSDWTRESALAASAALAGGRIILQSAAELDVRVKESARDIVTKVDVEVERALIEILAGAGCPTLGEESAASGSFHECPTWVIDPIDGTANFVHGMEYFAVSIGLCHGLEFLTGAVYLPRLDQLYAASANGAQLNGMPIEHLHRPFNQSLVAAGFANYAHDPDHRARQYEVFGTINDVSRGCLRLGSTAVNICFAAAGRVQAAYGLQAKIWDAAGAIAVAIAAGCKVMVAPCGDKHGIDYVVGSRDAVAAIHQLCVGRGLMSEACKVWN